MILNQKLIRYTQKQIDKQIPSPYSDSTTIESHLSAKSKQGIVIMQ